MTSVVQPTVNDDYTALPRVLRSGAVLGVIQAAAVAAASLGFRLLSGVPEQLFVAAAVLAGVGATLALPGIWTRARTIEGIAGAAGIGLWASFIFMIADVAILQPIGTWTNRWLAIGGGSNWWQHPVWWMTGTYLAWIGAWALARQKAKGTSGSPLGYLAMVVIGALAIGALAASVGFPGANMGLGTFGVAILPAAACATALAGVGKSSGV